MICKRIDFSSKLLTLSKRATCLQFVRMIHLVFPFCLFRIWIKALFLNIRSGLKISSASATLLSSVFCGTYKGPLHWMFISPPPPCIPFCIPLYTFLYALHTPAVYLSLEIHTNPHNLCTASHLNHQHHDLVSSYITLWAMAGVLLGSDKLIAHQLN